MSALIGSSTARTGSLSGPSNRIRHPSNESTHQYIGFSTTKHAKYTKKDIPVDIETFRVFRVFRSFYPSAGDRHRSGGLRIDR
jgi:hypothetical protein